MLAAIGKLLEIESDIRIISKRRGSVKLTLELTHAHAERLLWAVKGKELEEFDVTSVRVLSSAKAKNTEIIGSESARRGSATNLTHASDLNAQEPAAEHDVRRPTSFLDLRGDASRVDLVGLKIFCDVVQFGGFSRAAVEHGISQSSASQVVRQLEVRLGVKLFDRSRPLLLTPQGKVYHEGCKDLVERYLDLENRVRAIEGEDTVVGTVEVAAIYSVALSHMGRYVEAFEERYPRANVRLEYLQPSHVIERVTNGEAELGVLSFPRKSPELKVIPWRQESMVVAVHPLHPFAGRSSISTDKLDGEPFVAFDLDLPIRRAIDRFLRSHDVAVNVVLEFDNIEKIKRAVEIPAGISILPEPSIAREIEAGTLVAIPIERDDLGDRLTRPLAIVHRRRVSFKPATARFLNLLTGDLAKR